LEISGKKWASAALLSILIPISLLATSRFTGILQEPLMPETIEAETVNWNITRPLLNSGDAVPLHKTIVNSYEDSSILTRFEVNVGAYYEDYAESFFPFYGNDGLEIRLNATAEVTKGFVHSIAFSFSQQEGNATLEIWNDPKAMELYNVKLANLHDAWLIEETYAEFYGENQSQRCGVEIQVAWVFFDKNRMDQQIATTLELVYFDGTTYRKAVLPILLKVLTP